MNEEDIVHADSIAGEIKNTLEVLRKSSHVERTENASFSLV